ncbi:MAG: beta-Ala-His dipeptidase [Clostridia bacterium]|nr:beta-Ala-His dipeptidase [Clostridia bacterium]
MRAQKVIDEFMRFSPIPHGSGNEKAVGEYLINWAKEHNLKCEMDSYGNVIMEKAASEGYENSERVILQSHMDMVCVADSDKKYNPLTDPIEVYRDGDFLKAKGTSLGADDGAGVAMMLYILSDNTLKHPPIRAIFTVEEETSMKGAENLDVKYLDGKYLLNLDWEEKDSISSSCSNTVSIIFDDEVKREKNAKRAYRIKVMNLLGGHSGCDINLPRASAIKLLANIIMDTDATIAYFSAGRVVNAICAEAEAVVVCDDDIINAVKTFEEAVKAEYPNEEKVTFIVEECEAESVLSKADSDKFISFLVSVHSGVFYMSKYTPDFVETSQNIGIVKLNDTLHIEILARSSSKFHSEERKRAAKALSKIYGYSLSLPSENPIWEEKGENNLIRIMKKAYNEVVGEELKVIGVHAGLECAFFSSVKPDMQMVSVGPQLYDVHSPKERWEISSLPETIDFVVRALEMMRN